MRQQQKNKHFQNYIQINRINQLPQEAFQIYKYLFHFFLPSNYLKKFQLIGTFLKNHNFPQHMKKNNILQQNQIDTLNKDNLLKLLKNIQNKRVMNQNIQYFKSDMDFLNSSQTSFTDVQINFSSKNIFLKNQSKLISKFANFDELSTLILELRCDSLGLNGAIVLGTALSSCKNIQNLTLKILENQQFTAEGLSSLFHAFHGLTNLQTFKLSMGGNWVDDEGFQNISQALANCFNLQELNFNFFCNGVSNIGISRLASVLKNWSKLKILTLIFELNSIGIQGAFNLCSALQRSFSITSLTLNFYENYLNQENEKKLMKKIYKMKKLVKKSIYF
ncbi:hypothetical protein TTHERM_001292214 (macronuclear) [Tetrahymena thermophila SB210]|uniref:Kinase domain protein n=1 Tax=Tetrahymena thermophila (strain SB210) TaxID=312017 RepID=W7XKR6_TETTS|nr:hypothetical protein TTHERM_001292214 [Tetrahymena thermophila SB210]EWS76756.1 hypothetical protein TTHERM_001292214 [Tetrahymena thermophila SB210]|eukprot:XP_012650704.1 hypothetical protein TTHERM_001292214 [Tetrahymena thermophila SB210]